MEKHAADISSHMALAVKKGKNDPPFFRLDKSHMASCPEDSIDYALMEQSDKVAVVPADIGWSDIGSWEALWQVLPKDAKGNVLHGDVVVENVFDKIHSVSFVEFVSFGLSGNQSFFTA